MQGLSQSSEHDFYACTHSNMGESLTRSHLLIIQVNLFYGEVANLNFIWSHKHSIIRSASEISFALNAVRKILFSVLYAKRNIETTLTIHRSCPLAHHTRCRPIHPRLSRIWFYRRIALFLVCSNPLRWTQLDI
jgi:uncharacterized membrane protein YGL010W